MLGPRTTSSAKNLPPVVLLRVLEQVEMPHDVYTCILVSRLWCECVIKALWQTPFPQLNSDAQSIVLEPPHTRPSMDFVHRVVFCALSADIASHTVAWFTIWTDLARLKLTDDCSTVFDGALANMISSLPRLSHIGTPAVLETNDTVLCAIARTCTKLKKLDISGCSLVTDDGVVAVARACAALRTIEMKNVPQLTDVAVCALTLHCPRLRHLNVVNCPKIGDTGVRAACQIAELQEIFLSHGAAAAFGDIGFPAACTTVPGAGHTGEDGDGARTLFLPVPKLDDLRILELRECSLLTDAAIHRIVSGAPRLRTLVLDKSSGLGDDALASIAKHGSHLRQLHIRHLDKITDAGVLLVARSCARLQKIDLSCCASLTDASVAALNECSKLRRVGLVRIAHLTNDSVLALAQGNPKLERVHLSYNTKLTLPAIHELLQHLPRLRRLSLTGVPAFLLPEIKKISDSAPASMSARSAASFRIFSDEGVAGLRRHLQEVMPMDGIEAPGA